MCDGCVTSTCTVSAEITMLNRLLTPRLKNINKIELRLNIEPPDRPGDDNLKYKYVHIHAAANAWLVMTAGADESYFELLWRARVLSVQSEARVLSSSNH